MSPQAFSVPAGGTYEWPLSPSLDSRFWAKVEKRDPDECWPWTGFLRRDGYGMIRNGTRMATSHRVAWVLANGPVPVGLHILHHCDNRACCNPAHLYAGTNSDNVADKVRRGRTPKEQPRKQGEKHPLAKLSQQQVDEIRASATGSRGEGRMFARRYGVSPATICNILKGKSWAR